MTAPTPRRTRRGFQTEAEMAAVVVTWLREQGWDVFQEVKAWGPVADIVALQHGRSWIIECKLTGSLALLDQALAWVGHAHYVSVAVPARGFRRGGLAWDRILRDSGVGDIRVHDPINDEWAKTAYSPVRPNHHPRLNRRVVTDWRDVVCDAMRTTCPAGSANGGYWTPFRETCRLVEDMARKSPGITMKELIASVRHHYSSDFVARTCMANWIREGKIEGVTIEEGRPLRVVLVKESAS